MLSFLAARLLFFEKKDRTPDEDDMLDMMLHGGERVKEENLGAVLDWYSAQR